MLMTTQEQAELVAYCRARAGAVLLDAEYPGWAEEIDLDTLDMGDCIECVLGQLYGDYMDGMAALDPAAAESDEEPAWAVDLGFNFGDMATEYSDLDRAWRAEITKRLEAAS